MTWWTGQNIETPVRDTSGNNWHFRFWHSHHEGIYVQRVFFWNEDQTISGYKELKDGDTLNIKKLKQLKERLAKRPDYRDQYLFDLSFPIEENYSNYEELNYENT